jgi:hypothetical protein
MICQSTGRPITLVTVYRSFALVIRVVTQRVSPPNDHS